MKKILLSLFILFMPVCLWSGGVLFMSGGVESGGVSYISQLPFTDNAATTAVTNDGTGSPWVAHHNTDVYHTTVDLDGTENSYLFDGGSEGIESSDNVTTEKFESKYYFQWTDPNANGQFSGLGQLWGINSNLTPQDNSMTIWVENLGTEIKLTMRSSTSSTVTWISTNWTMDTNTHIITTTTDASGAIDGFQSVVIKQGATTLTWDSSTYPTGAVTFNSPEMLATNASRSPKAYYAGHTFEDQQ